MNRIHTSELMCGEGLAINGALLNLSEACSTKLARPHVKSEFSSGHLEIFNSCGDSSTFFFSNKPFFQFPLWMFKFINLPKQFNDVSAERKFDFLIGRLCILESIMKSNLCTLSSELCITQDLEGAPIIPSSNLICSVTHSESTASAFVGSKDQYLGIGIDSERIIKTEVALEISSVVLTAEETKAFQNSFHKYFSFAEYVTILFSLKESIFKCYWSQIRKYFDFQAVSVTGIDFNQGIVEFKLDQDLAPNYLRGHQSQGKFQFYDQYVHTLVLIERT